METNIIQTPEFIAKLKRYAEIKAQVKELETEAEAINPEILQAMVDTGTKEIPTDVGFFTTYERRTWKYPDEVTALKAQFDEAKKTSEQLGTATYEINNSLRFSTTAPKEVKE